MNPMLTRLIVTVLPLVAFGAHAADTNANRVVAVTQTPGCVAFWDFVKREPDGAHCFTAHVPREPRRTIPSMPANYIKDYWGAGREATYADFPLLGRGPFGNAVRIVKETDPDFARSCSCCASGRMIRRWTSKARASPSPSSSGPSARAGTTPWRASGMKARI